MAPTRKAPVPPDELQIDPIQQAALQQMTTYSFIGSPEKVYKEMQKFVDETQVDELMITSPIYEHAARLHSYEIIGKFKDGDIIDI